MVKGVSGFTGPTADVDFAVGSVLGTRSFQVNENKKLTGVTFSDYEYVDGENVAKCELCALDNELAALEQKLEQRTRDVNSALERMGQPHRIESPGSTVKSRTMSDCGHGFWAYFDKTDNFQAPHTVSGIVEGYGEVVIGELGFRATKARILALVAPKEVENKYSIKFNIIAMIAALVAIFAVSSISVIFKMEETYSQIVTTFFPIAFNAALWFCIFMLFKDMKYRRGALELVDKIKKSPLVDPMEIAKSMNQNTSSVYIVDVISNAQTSLYFDQVKQNYPSVKIFPTKEEMFKAYPDLDEQKSKWEKVVYN